MRAWDGHGVRRVASNGKCRLKREDGLVEMLPQSRGRLRTGDKITFADGNFSGQLVERKERGIWKVGFGKQDVGAMLESSGRAPSFLTLPTSPCYAFM